jgi:hypothetical protein
MLSQAGVSAFLADGYVAIRGDVFLCHPFLLPAASWPHRGHQPRIIAQPGVARQEEYSLHERPGGQPPPVQQAILDSLAAARGRNGGER